MSVLDFGKGLLDFFKDMLAFLTCPISGSVYLYTASVWAVTNADKPKRSLSPETRRILQGFFGDLDLTSVKVVEDARFPFFVISPSADLVLDFSTINAIALSPFIYWKGEFSQDNPCSETGIDTFRRLMHELVHIRQQRSMGTAEFACEYGRQSKRGYAANFLERQADEFATEHVEKLRETCAEEGAPGSRKRKDLSWLWLLWGA